MAPDDFSQGAARLGAMRLSTTLCCVLGIGGAHLARTDESVGVVHGMTISCQTNGREWGTPGFARELDRLRGLGVNWVAIHPYARIHADGRVGWGEWQPEEPPQHVAGPIADALEREVAIFVKPHLAYWGSPFDWRGAIDFEDPAERALFFDQYHAWIVAMAEVCRDADAFAIGTELDRFLKPEDEPRWRALIADVRTRTNARLTYAANWDHFERVPFWDALDAIGVQAYFPLADCEARPNVDDLTAAWEPWLERLRAVSERSGKPVVFTELGYDAQSKAACEPWVGKPWHGFGRQRHTPAEAALQQRCYEVALTMLERERDWLRGAFLWKWFVGPAPGADFVLDTPPVRNLIQARWKR